MKLLVVFALFALLAVANGADPAPAACCKAADTCHPSVPKCPNEASEPNVDMKKLTVQPVIEGQAESKSCCKTDCAEHEVKCEAEEVHHEESACCPKEAECPEHVSPCEEEKTEEQHEPEHEQEREQSEEMDENAAARELEEERPHEYHVHHEHHESPESPCAEGDKCAIAHKEEERLEAEKDHLKEVEAHVEEALHHVHEEIQHVEGAAADGLPDEMAGEQQDEQQQGEQQQSEQQQSEQQQSEQQQGEQQQHHHHHHHAEQQQAPAVVLEKEALAKEAEELAATLTHVTEEEAKVEEAEETAEEKTEECAKEQGCDEEHHSEQTEQHDQEQESASAEFKAMAEAERVRDEQREDQLVEDLKGEEQPHGPSVEETHNSNACECADDAAECSCTHHEDEGAKIQMVPSGTMSPAAAAENACCAADPCKQLQPKCASHPAFVETFDTARSCCTADPCHESAPKCPEYVSPEIVQKKEEECGASPCAAEHAAEPATECGCHACPCEEKKEYVSPEIKQPECPCAHEPTTCDCLPHNTAVVSGHQV